MDPFEYKLVSTGQQPQDLASLEKAISVKPDFVFRDPNSLPLTNLNQVVNWTFKTLLQLKRLFSSSEFKRSASTIVVHGDTLTSTLAALIGYLSQHRVAHIEAGLRSGNLLNPFPEEIDRIFTSFLATLHFAPGLKAAHNLMGKRGEIVNTHLNTVVDSLTDVPKLRPSGLNLPKDFALICLHRTELLSNKSMLSQTLRTIGEMSLRIPIVMVIDPLTESTLQNQEDYAMIESSPDVSIIKKIIYPEFQYLLQNCEFLVTDSGGQQEEAAQLGIPCIVHRRATERHEGLGENAILSYWDQQSLLKFAQNYSEYRRPAAKIGRSPSDIIVNSLRSPIYD
jgi:UDP-N-acetylglucosamine 2-epimerase (non-hydrolysing)